MEDHYDEYNEHDNPSGQYWTPTSIAKPTLHNSASVNGPALTVKLQLRNLREKYDSLDQTVKTLQLENQEYSSEITKLHKENEELKTKNKRLSQEHSEIFDNKKSMANILSVKSIELDKQHNTIGTLQNKILKQTQSIKTLRTHNDILMKDNKNFKQCLEETVTKNSLYLQEKQEYIKQIEVLTHGIQELQHQIYMYSISPIPDEEFKSIEQSANGRNSYSSSAAVSKAKTVRFQLDVNSRHSSYDDEEHHHNKKIMYGWGLSTKSIMSAVSGTSYMGINELRDKSSRNLELMPLMDSPQNTSFNSDITDIDIVKNINPNIHLTQSDTDEVGMNYNPNDHHELPLGYDAATMHLDNKFSQLLDTHQKNIYSLNNKYNDLNGKYEKLQSDYNQQKIKLKKRANIIKELRAQNNNLNKKAASNKSCIWFN